MLSKQDTKNAVKGFMKILLPKTVKFYYQTNSEGNQQE